MKIVISDIDVEDMERATEFILSNMKRKLYAGYEAASYSPGRAPIVFEGITDNVFEVAYLED